MSIFIAWALKALTSRTGIAIAVGFALITFASLQTMRLDHAKHDLSVARAALINPATGHTWRADYQIAAPALAVCNTDLGNVTAALNRQNLAMKALGDETARMRAESAAALSTARRATASARARADAILSTPAGPDACQNALAMIRGQ